MAQFQGSLHDYDINYDHREWLTFSEEEIIDVFLENIREFDFYKGDYPERLQVSVLAPKNNRTTIIINRYTKYEIKFSFSEILRNLMVIKTKNNYLIIMKKILNNLFKVMKNKLKYNFDFMEGNGLGLFLVFNEIKKTKLLDEFFTIYFKNLYDDIEEEIKNKQDIKDMKFPIDKIIEQVIINAKYENEILIIRLYRSVFRYTKEDIENYLLENEFLMRDTVLKRDLKIKKLLSID